MPKISLKQLESGKWIPVQVADIVGMSIAKFMVESEKTIVAAIVDGDKPVAFISNSDKYVEHYRSHGCSLHAKDLIELVGTEVIPKISLDFISGSDIVGVKSLRK